MSDLDKEAVELLVVARVRMLRQIPFFGNLATRMKLINADDWCQTAATDGRNFYYNTKFIKSLPIDQLIFLFGHELLHAAYSHCERRGKRDPILANIAADFVVNADCIKYNIGTKIPSALYDEKYDGMSFEEVYDELFKNAEKIKAKFGKGVLDEHLDPSGEEDADGAGNRDPSAKGKPTISAAEMEEIKKELQEAMIQASEIAHGGNIPANLKRMLNELTEPKIDWVQVIRQNIQSQEKYDTTYMRSSRKGWDIDAILPGSDYGTSIDVAIGIDSSGSMSQAELTKILSEVKGIAQAFNDFKITLWCSDSKVYNPQTFDPTNIDQIDEYELKGGGGNDFTSNWSYMKEVGLTPKLFIYFTDGYHCGSGWGDPDYCDTLWVIHGNNPEEPAHGDWVKYEIEARG